jgi:hypothetical protein
MIKEPSNRTAALFLITFFLVVFIIAISIYKEKTSQVVTRDEVEDSISLSVGEVSGSTEDGDADGLSDWEEALWKTDPANPDTDGDGTNDGDEVLARRDPTVPAPGDEVSEIEAEKSFLLSQKSVYKDFEEGSLTDMVAQSLFTSYAGLKQSNSLGTQTETQAISDLTQQAKAQVGFIGPYSSSELVTFNQETVANLKSYGNAFGQAQVDLIVNLQKVDEADQSNPIGRVYRQHSERLMSLSVPNSQKERHVSIANQYYVLSQTLTNLTAYKKDPMKALLSVEQYQKSQEQLLIFYSTLQTFLRNNGIIFNDNEPGSVLYANF